LSGFCETGSTEPTRRSVGNCPRRTAAMPARRVVLHCQKTLFYFNELSDRVNEKISTSKA
jgi:hypothetical protein